MTHDMDDILESFVVETIENLDEIEPVLIGLGGIVSGGHGVDLDVVNQIFRVFHTIKGTAGFLNLPRIETLTHEAETVLDQIRNGELLYESAHTTILCEVIDLLRSLVTMANDAGSDHGFESAVATLLARLRQSGARADERVALELGEAPSAEQAAEPDRATPPTRGTTARQERLAPDQVRLFVEESLELLQRVETALLQWREGDPAYDEIFRWIHSFKGNCGFAGLEAAERLSHVMETELDALRRGLMSSDVLFVDEWLQQTDALRQCLSGFADGGDGVIPDLESRVASISRHSARVPTESGSISPGATLAPKILVVDDDRTIRDTLAFGLTACDWPVVCVGTSRAAVEHLSIHSDVDVLVTDLHMPEESGIELIETVRRRWPGIPVVAITADTGRDVLKQLVNLGVEQFIEKPFVIDHVRTACLDAIARRDREHEHLRLQREEQAARARKATAQSHIRVATTKLDKMVNLVGEMVIAEAMLTQYPLIADSKIADLKRRVYNVRRVMHELRDAVMTVRMVPLSTTFQKMIRLTHDVAAKSRKQVALTLVGEETEVDKTIIEQIGDPLVHILRNAIDHGIEPPRDRELLGKPAKGTLVLEGRQEGNEVVIRISDDGRGIDRAAVQRKAIDRGLLSPEAPDLTDETVFGMIFEPGFSTADSVSDLSGRGVGMDVVKKNIESLGGRVTIASERGRGTLISLHIPLTLAIIDGMLVCVGEEQLTLPILAVRETLRLRGRRLVHTPDGNTLLKIRESLIPLVRLGDLCNRAHTSRDFEDGIAVVVESDGKRVALFCDAIVDRIEAVVKSLPPHVAGARCVSSCTILGNGRISLILDIRRVIAWMERGDDAA